jgi:hypothetical protein
MRTPWTGFRFALLKRRHARERPLDRPSARGGRAHERGGAGSGAPRLAGRAIEGPMAIVILGRLTTSTLLSLFVLPTLALRFGRFDVAPDGADEEMLR